MSIKSDKWIREQSTVPKFVITKVIQAPVVAINGIADAVYRTKTIECFSYLTSEELDRIINARKNSLLMAAVCEDIVSYRELTPEEIAAHKPMIEPFVDHQIRTKNTEQKIVSYGLSSFGYDVRLADEFKIFTNINSSIIDPLNFDHNTCVDHKGEYCLIPPNSYVLGRTMETFIIPRDVMVICLGKSTYARCGAIVNTTPIEAGFEGQVVIEISNATSLPLKVYAGQGIAQFLFFQSNEECSVSYADRKGKYQGQSGLQTALV